MKKFSFLMVSVVTLFFMTINIDAVEKKVNYDYEIGKKIFSADSKKSVNAQSTEVDEYLEKQGPNSISKKGDKYYNSGKEIVGVSEREESGYTVLSYNDRAGEIESWYKYISAEKGYAHVKNVIYLDIEYIGKVIVEYNFFYHENKCQNTSDLIAGACTNKYDVNKVKQTLPESGLFYTGGANMTYYYSSYAKKIGEYDKSVLIAGVREEDKIYKITENGYIDRDSKTKNIKKMRTYYYIGKKKQASSYIYPGNKTKDVYNINSKKEYYYYYNAKGQITKRWYFKYVYAKKDYVQYSQEQWRSYHKNGKVKQLYTKFSKDDNKYKAAKINYTSKGKKIDYKVRNYKKNKVTKQAYLKYKNNKKYYMNVVKYNKKGKAYSATRTKYNKKGKKIKTYRIKLTKKVVRW